MGTETSPWPRIRPGGIATALLIRVVIFSSLVTLGLTVLQLTLSYRSERGRLEARLGEVEQANAQSIAESLWALDARQLETQVQGILRLPAIRRVEVRESGRPTQGFALSRGESTGRDILVKESVLRCCGAAPTDIGVLRVEATLTEIYHDIAIQALVILLSNAAKTFLVAFFILWVVHHLATRHLLDIAKALGDRSGDGGQGPLRLRRTRSRRDELDQLVDALNEMRERLKHDAAQLRNANLRMSAILDNMPDLAWVKDAQGRFMAVNRALAAANGYDDPKLLVGLSDHDLHSPDHGASYLRDDQEVMATRRSMRFEEQHTNADGSTSQIETLKSPLLDAEGHVVGTVAVARDISSRRQAEADREARRMAEFASRAKSEFVAHISHEIRTPMNAIVGMAQLAEHSGMNPAQLALVHKIQRAARMLLVIVNDILDLSKVEAGKLTVESVPLDLANALTDVVELLETSAKDKGIALRVELPDPQPARVLGDPTRLRQVLLNLAANAVKFTAEGQVVLSLRVLEPTPGSVRVRFQVSDTGIGMSPELMRALFTPFMQGDSSMSRRYGGTGLGLAISRHLVRLMGGDIAVESSVGVGSRFSFDLCLATAAPGNAADLDAAPVKGKSALADLRGTHVLLVEDNEVNRETGHALLSFLGARVSLASDGQQALQMLEEDQFDAVLMDCQMPVMNGFEATRRIRQDARWRNLPVIALTATVRGSDVDSALASGMTDHLAKPVDLSTLGSTLLRWIRRPAG